MIESLIPHHDQNMIQICSVFIPLFTWSLFLQLQEKFPKVIPIDPRLGERAVLVKDFEGDYAIVIGRWQVFKNKEPHLVACTFLKVTRAVYNIDLGFIWAVCKFVHP